MATQSNYPYRLFAPGPVPLSEGIRKALSETMIHHRSEAFKKKLRESLNLLQHVFQTHQPVMILNTAGSGAMEAALVNTISPNDEVLFIVSGKFGERWWKMGQAYNLKCHVLKVPWGQAFDGQALEEKLNECPNIKGVFCQACETSTGVAHPIQKLSQIIRQHTHNTLIIIDAMTAMGAMPLPMDDWDLDVVISGSQKAFMLPAGLSFIALSKRAWTAANKCTTPKFYFDLAEELKANLKNETRFSSSVSLIRGLHCALKENFTEDERLTKITRCQNLAQATREVCEHVYGLKLFSQAPSSSVTAVSIPEELQDKGLNKILLNKYHLFVGDGQDHLKGKIFRVGHLGHITNDDQLFFAQALGLALQESGWHVVTDATITDALALTRTLLEK